MDHRKFTIATLGSHSALQILKGAKDEEFKTLIITTPDRVDFYKRFKFISEIFSVDSFVDFPKMEGKLKKKNVIIIPHGSFVAYLGVNNNKNMELPYYGNKSVLDWEENRNKQREWLIKSGIKVPRQFNSVDEVTHYPVIIKTYGAAGGKGYFYAKNKKDFKKKIITLKNKKFIIQEYIIGVTAYLHYFYSPITKQLELFSIDRRYETNVDSLGRIPLHGQQDLLIDPSYVVVGNAPLVIRESLLPEAYEMGERVVRSSKEIIGGKGLFGPFCLETVITPDQEFFAMEISCRIVAGTNLFTNGSPYSWLNYNEPMSTGRRIAREIKLAIKENQLKKILDE